MRDRTKFYLFAGIFGTGVIALLAGAYYWDFAPKTAKPAGDGFVTTQVPGSTPTMPRARRPVPLPDATPSESTGAPRPAAAASVPISADSPSRPAASTTPPLAQNASVPSTPDTLKKVDQQLRAIRRDLRILTVEQRRMDQRLLRWQRVRLARSPVALPGMARSISPAKALPGWSVESIGAGQAWIQGPSGNTHVVQAGADLDGFRVLAVDPDQVLTTRGRIGY